MKLRQLLFFEMLLFLGFAVSVDSAVSEKNYPKEYRNYYEIFVYSFYDSDGDGIGDLKGVEEKLDYIADLGFNGIWLMPVMPSPTYHKYDVTDYLAIDPQYGSLEDFQSLSAACDEKNIYLIIDLAINHSSSQHPWFQEACQYLGTLTADEKPNSEVCPYVDYYHFSKEPASSSWYPVPGSAWYYEGAFWDQMPDLNLSCDALKSDIEDISDFWIENGVDGFRIDAALHFEENQTDFNIETLSWLYQYCKEKNPDFYMVSEVWADEKTIAKYYESQTPSFFNFPLSGVDGSLCKAALGNGSANALVKAMKRLEDLYSENNPDYIDAPFLTNHDQPRIANNLKSEEDAIKMAGGLLLMMNGNPFVYYGEEIGMKSEGQSDENKRLPMNWYKDKTANGMTVGPENSSKEFEQKFPSAEEQLNDPDSILNYYKRALALRNSIPEIASGKIDLIEELCTRTEAAITKTFHDSTIAIIYNTGKESIQLDLENTPLMDGELQGILTLHPTEKITYENHIIAMPARSIAILKL